MCFCPYILQFVLGDGVVIYAFVVCIALYCPCAFAMQIWPQVKAANPHLSSVTEIGAVVGAMWRDLDPVEKQRYNDQFNKEKVTLRNFKPSYCFISHHMVVRGIRSLLHVILFVFCSFCKVTDFLASTKVRA